MKTISKQEPEVYSGGTGAGHPHQQTGRLASLARMALLAHPLEAGVIVVVVVAALLFDQEGLASPLAQVAGMLPEVILLPLWNPALDEYIVGVLDNQCHVR